MGAGAPTVDGTPGMPPSPNCSGPIPAARLRAISSSAARARGASFLSDRRRPARQQAFGRLAYLGRDVEDGQVAQDRDGLVVTDPLQRGDQMKAADGRRRVHRGLDLRDRGALVAREPLGRGPDQRIVAPHQDVDLVADVAVVDLLAGGGRETEAEKGRGDADPSP